MQRVFLVLLFAHLSLLYAIPSPNCQGVFKKIGARKLYAPLLSTNDEALRTTKINTTFPSPNIFSPAPEKWLAPDSEYTQQMATRRELYAKRSSDILKIQPGQEEGVRSAAQEFLEMTAKHLIAQFPGEFSQDGLTLKSKSTGAVVSLDSTSGPHPLEKLGMLLQDDVTVNLKQADGKVILAGGFLATPTNWSLQDFIGVDVHAIHAGIPEYENRLKKTVEGTVERGVRGKCIARNNWFLVTNPELALPSYRRSTYKEPAITETNVGSNLFLRSELESIVNLPVTGATIFTIRPRVWSMEFVKANAPEVAKNLATAIQLPESGYSEMEWKKPLLKFLSETPPANEELKPQ